MKTNFLSNLVLSISIFSVILVVLRSIGIIQVPMEIINLLLITVLSIMTWINYKYNRKMQMYAGIFMLVAFVGLTFL